ncbi:MAG TPA: lipocalin family protein [Pyrinomonadaceae bacterium]|nr:lipocalin family protein [Pyrinomonadaceae bacterium]HMP66631.1 lipocalin family protein [Pyrinomonadaceae bacterium]
MTRTQKVAVLLLGFHLFAAVALSQSAKFDIVTYKAPAGWEVEKDADSLSFSKASDGGYCVIVLSKSVESVGDSSANFELVWKGMVSGDLGTTGPPQRIKPEDKDGWRAEAGVAAFENKDLAGVALLTVYTGNDRAVAVLAITNSESFQDDIGSFLGSLGFPPANGVSTAPSQPNISQERNSRLIGRWQRSSSVSVGYGDPVSLGTGGYTKSRYEFLADGTYHFTSRIFGVASNRIIIIKESGRYTISGDTLTIVPVKSVVEAYSKAGGGDALGTRVTSTARRLEKADYKFTFHYFEGIGEWNLVLQAASETHRDGSFSGNKTFANAWYFDQQYTNGDLTSVRGN